MSDEQLDELLSGFLDGELELHEQQQLDQLLQTDARAVTRLEQLRKARTTLAQIPMRRLPTDFAAQVIARAQQRAIQEKLPASHPICKGKANSSSQAGAAPHVVTLASSSSETSSVDRVSTNQTSRNHTYRNIAILAASVVLVCGFIYRMQVTPSSSEQVGAGQGAGTIAQAGPTSENATANGSENSVAVVGGKQGSNTTTENSPITKEQSSTVNPELIADANSSNRAVGTLNTPATNNSSEPTRSQENMVDADLQRQLAEMAKQNGTSAFPVLFVVDMTVTADAWERQEFSRILAEYEIQYADPITADESLVEALRESRLATTTAEGGETKVEAQPNQENIRMMFVQAPVKILDRAIIDMYRNTSDFPVVAFDLALDAPCLEVRNQLRGIFEKEVAPDRHIARVVQPDEDFGGSFVGAGRRKSGVPFEVRQGANSVLDTTPDQNPVDQVMFVLRAPKGAKGTP